jgi:hypothetical protein
MPCSRGERALGDGPSMRRYEVGIINGAMLLSKPRDLVA